MKKQLVVNIVLGCLLWAGGNPSGASAGALEPPAAPDDPGSAMYSTESIYQRLYLGALGSKRVEGFSGPLSGPGATGRSLDEIMAVAPVPDDTTAAEAGQVEVGKTYWGLRGNAWGPQSGTATTARFTDNGDGTVTDTRTNLVWLKDANCAGGLETWGEAIAFANGLQAGNVNCELNDNSTAGDWRLPQIQELKSLINRGSAGPALLPNAPFDNVGNLVYWSSTTFAGAAGSAWSVNFDDGVVSPMSKDTPYLVWPVRNAVPVQ